MTFFFTPLRLCVGLALALPAPQAQAAGRHLSVIIDTSGSMLGSDPRRHTLQLTQILADLLEPEDSLTAIRLPQSEPGCDAPADFRLAQSTGSHPRSGFQTLLDRLLVYGGGNTFAAPVHTAMADLQKHREKSRLLLFLADSGGLGSCNNVLTQELSSLKADGVMVAAINLGGAGAFDRNPAFSFTTGAMDARELANAVGQVYQLFIGGKQVKTGTVQGGVEVEIQPMARQAYLIVAADGEMGGIEALESNPTAAGIDLNYLGGGHTVGLDRRRRDYRIVRLLRPETGRWAFKVPYLTGSAGWILLQDSALGLRLISSPKLALGLASPVQAELYDRDTGQRVAEPGLWPKLAASVVIDGQAVALRDDGQNGDLRAGDGIFTGQATASRPGRQRAALRLESDSLDRTSDWELEVEAVAWRLLPQVPARAEIDSALNLRVAAQANPNAVAPEPLARIEVQGANGEPVATLRDDGEHGDAQAGDGIYNGLWTPSKTGDQVLRFTGIGPSLSQTASTAVQAIGSLQFPAPVPVALGKAGSHSQIQGMLDLSGTTVKGEFPVELSSDFANGSSALEIDLGQGWVPLNANPRPLLLAQTGLRRWPVRLRVGGCPGATVADSRFHIEFKGVDAQGQALSHTVPLSLEIAADPWLHCWWPLLAAGAGALLAAILLHGFWSPSRFSPRLGVVLSPEEDMNEGFFHPIRAQRGTGSGFYRDARVYIRQDFRLSGQRKAAFACFRADGKRVQIRPIAPLWRLNLDGEWEALPDGESPAQFGVVYKNSMGSLFFEIRNG